MKKPLRLVGSVTLLAVIAWRLDWARVGAAFGGLDAGYWLAGLGIYLIAQMASALRWQLLAGALGLAGGFGRYFAYYFIGMFFNLVLPTSVGGDVVRAWYLAQQAGPRPPHGRRTAAFLSVLADRVNGLAVLVLVACVALPFFPQALPLWVTGTVWGMGAGAVAGLAALPLLPWLYRRMPGRPRIQQVLAGGIEYLRHPRLLGVVTFLSLVVQLANIVLAWLVARGLGLEVPFTYCCVLISVVSTLTLLPISVNGMGLREMGTAVLLTPLGVGEAEAVTLSLLIFAAQAAASLGGSVFYLFGRFPRFVAQDEAPPGPVVLEGGPDAHAIDYHSDQGRARQPPAAA